MYSAGRVVQPGACVRARWSRELDSPSFFVAFRFCRSGTDVKSVSFVQSTGRDEKVGEIVERKFS